MRRRLSLSASVFCFVVSLIILMLLHLCFYIYVFDYIEVILIILCKKPYYTVRVMYTFYTLKVLMICISKILCIDSEVNRPDS